MNLSNKKKIIKSLSNKKTKDKSNQLVIQTKKRNRTNEFDTDIINIPQLYHEFKIDRVLFHSLYPPSKVPSVRTGSVFHKKLFLENPHDIRSKISDHLLLSSFPIFFENISLRIATFNACMSTYALRKKQGLLNPEKNEFYHMESTKSISVDDARRDMIVNYIMDELEKYDIICIQEIDYKCVELLKSHKNISLHMISFIELEKDSVYGGLAIIIKYHHSIINSQPIFDWWIDHDGKLKYKLIGQNVEIVIRNQINTLQKKIIVGNYHLKKICERLICPFLAKSNYVAGSFDCDISTLIPNVNDAFSNEINAKKNIKLYDITMREFNDTNLNIFDGIYKIEK